MGCQWLGGLGVDDPDFPEIFRKFVDSCIADGKHPKVQWVNRKKLALFCRDKATDAIGAAQERREIAYELALPAVALRELIAGRPYRFEYGRGHLELTYEAASPGRDVVLLEGRKVLEGRKAQRWRHGQAGRREMPPVRPGWNLGFGD